MDFNEKTTFPGTENDVCLKSYFLKTQFVLGPTIRIGDLLVLGLIYLTGLASA